MSDTKDNTVDNARRLKTWGAGVIILMIVLMLMPWNIGQRTHTSGHGVLVGKANGVDVSSIDVQNASAILEALDSLYVTLFDPMNPARAEPAPLLVALWGQELTTAMKRNPVAFHLLIQESRKHGPGANPNTLGSLEKDLQSTQDTGIFNSSFVTVEELHPLPQSPLYQINQTRFGQTIGLTQIQAIARQSFVKLSELPPLDQSRYYVALTDLLSVQSASSLARTAIKASTPMVDQLIARNGQTFTLQLASIDVRPLTETVGEPTDADLKTQLSTYANTPSGAVTRENPFGFGYQIGNSVKFQSLTLRRSEIRAVVEREKTPYEWEVAARMAYGKDAASFSSLAPATQPTTQSTTQPADTAANANAPVAFDLIKTGAIRMMIDKATDARVIEIERKLRSTQSLDYQMWSTARSTNAATQPSSLGVAFDSVDYLSKLAGTIQSDSRFQVLPVVRSEANRFFDADALTLDPELSRLSYVFPEDVARSLQTLNTSLPAAQYILNFAKPFMTASRIEQFGNAVLEPFRTSEALRDDSGETIAFIRITDTQPAHAATDIEPLRARLTADWKRSRAQVTALATANTALATIQSGGAFTVPGATITTVTITPPSFGQPIPAELGLTQAGFAQFYQRLGLELAGDPAGQPVAVLDVPVAQRVFVARRTGLTANWESAQELTENRLMIRKMLDESMALPSGPQNQFGLTDKAVVEDWFALDNVLSRNQYTAAKEGDARE